MPSAEFGRVTNYTTRCRYSNILASVKSGEGKRLPLLFLKYICIEGKGSFFSQWKVSVRKAEQRGSEGGFHY